MALRPEGTSLKSRYIEIIDVKHSGPEEEPKETAEQIIDRITTGINKLGKGG